VVAAAAERLVQSWPPERRNSRTFLAIAHALGSEFDLLYGAVRELAAQFFPRTATWTLDDWEARLGLSIQPAWPDGERQDRLVAHLRTFGTPTLQRIKDVALSFENGEIEVIQDHPAYNMILMFTGVQGVPANVAEFELTMRRLIHAHLALEIAYNYTTWAELTSQGLTWDALTALNLTWDQLSIAF
jgi:hypothetical protein